MPAEKMNKTNNRKAPYAYDGAHRSATSNPRPRTAQITLPQTSASIDIDAPPLPLGTLWHFGSDSSISPLKRTSDFVSCLSSYLKLKNEAYKDELQKMEEALYQAEVTAKKLKTTIATLGNTVDALEGAVAAASHILSASLICAICFETGSNPTSLKCGHSFCHDCLQGWFLSRFETRCLIKGINLAKSEYRYIYSCSSTASEAEHNMVQFAALSNRVMPDYVCPSCRDPLVPSLRNSFLDFKLTASLNTLNALIGYAPADAPPEWKTAGIDLLSFLNSRFFLRRSESTSTRFSADIFIESDDSDTTIDLDM